MWKTVKLGDVCEILDRLRKPITKKNRMAGNVPYYGATGIVDWIKDFIFDEKLVLVGEDGAKWDSGESTAFIIEGKTWVNNHAHVLRPIDGLLTHEWLAYYLTSIDLSPWVTGLTVPKLNQAQLRSIPIPLPPIEEQHRIVAKLDAAFAEIDGLINTASRQATNAKDVQLKIIEKLFFSEEKEWKKINLRTACKFSQGVQIPVEKQSLQICEGCTTRFLRIVDFTQGNEEPRFISDSDVKEILNEHDIAIVRYGASAGFVCTGLKGQIANNLFKVELETKEFDSDYLLCFLQSPMFSNFIASKVTGAAMPALSFSMFNDFDISYPSSRDRQLSLISKFHLVDRQIENLISFHEKKLLNLKQLKETILAQELQSEAA